MRTDEQIDMTKLIVTFRNFADVPKNYVNPNPNLGFIVKLLPDTSSFILKCGFNCRGYVSPSNIRHYTCALRRVRSATTSSALAFGDGIAPNL